MQETKYFPVQTANIKLSSFGDKNAYGRYSLSIPILITELL
jgi:hypothetical protein